MFYDVQYHLETFSTNVTTWFMWLSMWKRYLRHCIVKSYVSISRKKQRLIKHLQKKHTILETSWSSIIATYLIKLLSTRPFSKIYPSNKTQVFTWPSGVGAVIKTPLSLNWLNWLTTCHVSGVTCHMSRLTWAIPCQRSEKKGQYQKVDFFGWNVKGNTANWWFWSFFVISGCF